VDVEKAIVETETPRNMTEIVTERIRRIRRVCGPRFSPAIS